MRSGGDAGQCEDVDAIATAVGLPSSAYHVHTYGRMKSRAQFITLFLLYHLWLARGEVTR